MTRRRGWGALAGVPILAAVATAVAAQPAPDADALLARTATAWRAAGGVRAAFTQVVRDRMVGTFDSRGTLRHAPGGRLSLRFDDPKGDAIVADGTDVWLWTPSTTPGQVLRVRPGSGVPVTTDVLDRLLTRPAERATARWLGTETVGGRPQDVVTLAPADRSLPFAEATLWLDREDGLPRRLRWTEPTGVERTLTLARLQAGQRFAATEFRFAPPAGVRVVEP